MIDLNIVNFLTIGLISYVFAALFNMLMKWIGMRTVPSVAG